MHPVFIDGVTFFLRSLTAREMAFEQPIIERFLQILPRSNFTLSYKSQRYSYKRSVLETI